MKAEIEKEYIGTRNPKPEAGLRPRAFTLVELLTVIGIIVLLISILLPFLNRAKQVAKATKCQTLINLLSDGAKAYKLDTGYYPGQFEPTKVGSTFASNPRQYTGSQWLAGCLFSDKYATPTPGGPVFIQGAGPDANPDTGTGAYAPYTKEMILSPIQKGTDGMWRYATLGDNFSPQRPVLYFPSHIGNTTQTGVNTDEYLFSDNSAYKDLAGQSQASFTTFIMTGITGNKPPNDGEFLTIAPGIDGLYFTPDDVRNF